MKLKFFSGVLLHIKLKTLTIVSYIVIDL